MKNAHTVVKLQGVHVASNAKTLCVDILATTAMRMIAKYARIGLLTHANDVMRKQIVFHAHSVSREYAKASVSANKNQMDMKTSSELANFVNIGHINNELNANLKNVCLMEVDAGANVIITFIRTHNLLLFVRNATGIVVSNALDGHHSMEFVTTASFLLTRATKHVHNKYPGSLLLH